MWTDGVLQDIRFAVRGLIRHRGFSLAAVVTIALGIGITTAIFSAINGVLLRPLPYPEPGALVILNKTRPAMGADPFLSQPDLRDIQGATRTFEALFGYGTIGMTLTGFGEAERISGTRLTDPIFGVLGVQPVLGRDLTTTEALVDGPDIIVISYGFWQGRLSTSCSTSTRFLTIRYMCGCSKTSVYGTRTRRGRSCWSAIR